MAGARAGLADRVASAAVQVHEPKPPTVFDLIERQKNEIARALPKHLDAEQYVRAALTEVKRTKGLAECDATSLLGGLMLASRLGLELGPLGHAYLLPFRNKTTGRTEATFVLGYRGILDLAWRSGRLKSIEAHEVCRNDEFDFAYGLEPKLVHKPAIEGERGAAYAYYGVAHFKDGGYYFLVMSRAEVEEHRKRSRSKDNGPWITDFNAMARKTIIRAMAPYLPLSTEIAREIAHDETVARGLTQDEVTYDDSDILEVEALDDEPEQTADPETGEIKTNGLFGQEQ